ncbi:hypothetical protein Cgig2_005850 [Carnegiea gigantea]|uniref:Aldehyde oxidase GLOX n=1 Tax=Carnegiea gigantea TaxID=171969 RepID=A0A9Q1KP20_9CARY|nr:hypothetical protein Cgig2_005850 [Carnegiea gigantea]
MSSLSLFHDLLINTLIKLLLLHPSTVSAASQWRLLQRSIGISAMHMQLLSDDTVIIFDRTDFGPSNLSLPAGRCRHDPLDRALKTDCTAHSAQYDPTTNSFRPLTLLTDTWCSSGSTLPDGRLLQTGGFNDGDVVIRTFDPTTDADWSEISERLLARRWYATNHILPDGRVIIIGGRRQFNYEFFPKTPESSNLHSLPFLVQTSDPNIENNLYPFVFLNVDGNLFIFANNRAILFDYADNKVVRTYPEIPGGAPRSYPSTGSAVLLPLRNLDGPNVEVEVLVCGGAPKGSYVMALNKGQFMRALDTCARIKITDPNPASTVETMPMARVMGDMLLLPNGDVLIINGAASGTAGWELGRDPVLAPVVYHPDRAHGSRFEVQGKTTIPRMYHSLAVLLRDGRVLVGGSNPHRFYNFTNVLFPTELSLEAFLPQYLDPTQSDLRPVIVDPKSSSKLKYGELLQVKFSINGLSKLGSIRATMIRPPFATHSFSMSQSKTTSITNGTRVMKICDIYQDKVTLEISIDEIM